MVRPDIVVTIIKSIRYNHIFPAIKAEDIALNGSHTFYLFGNHRGNIHTTDCATRLMYHSYPRNHSFKLTLDWSELDLETIVIKELQSHVIHVIHNSNTTV